MLKEKSVYLRFIGNTLLFIFLVLLLDQLIGRGMRYMYFKRKSGDTYQTTYSMDSTKADIIILGSSRATHHYITQIFEDSLKLSCYNTGKDGEYLIYSYSVLTSILNRYSPKMVILDINVDEFYKNDNYKNSNTLFPYYHAKPEIQKVLETNNNFEMLKFLSYIYPYNSTLFGSLLHINTDINERKLKGYIPFYGSLSNISLSKEPSLIRSLDNFKINILEEIGKKCKKKGIKIMFIQSPRYVILDQSYLIEKLEKIAMSYNCEIYNYANDSQFLINSSLFKDVNHLNNDGAIIFSNIIIKKIKYSLRNHWIFRQC